MGTITFGTSSPNDRNRVPSPAARIKAFTKPERMPKILPEGNQALARSTKDCVLGDGLGAGGALGERALPDYR